MTRATSTAVTVWSAVARRLAFCVVTALHVLLSGCQTSRPATAGTGEVEDTTAAALGMARADDWQQLLGKHARRRADKAVAIAADANGQWVAGTAHGVRGDLPAARAALSACEAERALGGIRAACELVRVNERRIEHGRLLRARLEADGAGTPALLWSLRSPSGSQAWIGGTLHMLKPSMYPLPPAYEQAYASATTLVVELDNTRLTPNSINAMLARHAMLPSGQHLDDWLLGAPGKRIRDYVDDLGLPWLYYQAMKPSALVNAIATAAFATAGFAAEHGMDAHYLRRAHADGLRIVELETLDAQLAVVHGGAPPTAEQLASDLHNLASGNLINTLVAAWYGGDAEAFVKLFSAGARTPEQRALQHQLLDQRNRQMARRINDLLAAPDQRLFVLVGSGHVVGAQSVITELAQLGFEPVQVGKDGASYVPR